MPTNISIRAGVRCILCVSNFQKAGFLSRKPPKPPSKAPKWPSKAGKEGQRAANAISKAAIKHSTPKMELSKARKSVSEAPKEPSRHEISLKIRFFEKTLFLN
jgi:hypothetical protein